MQITSLLLALVVATVLAAVGCSSPNDSHNLRVGRELDRHDGGSAAGAGSSAASGDAGGIVTGQDDALKVHVENLQKMTITIVTVQCAGDCADVVAVASGGNAPYSFKWEDGSTNAKRHVCPTATSHYQVTATDTAVTATEFHYDAHRADSEVTADVLDCSDGGTDTNTAACIANPSFEGPVTTNQFAAFDAPPWNACYAGGFITYSAIGDNTLWPTQNWTFPKASDGATYLALGQQGALGGRTSQTLCKPLLAGETLSFLVDLARATSTNASLEATSQAITIVGGSTACNETDLLWTSAPLTTAWSTQCVTITAQHDMTSFGFMPLATEAVARWKVSSITSCRSPAVRDCDRLTARAAGSQLR